MPRDGLRAINVYVVEGTDGIALIDAGWNIRGNAELLLGGLSELGFAPTDIANIYITHIHRDHYTLGPELRRRHGARLHLGIRERDCLEEILDRQSNEPASSLEQLRRAGAFGLMSNMKVWATAEPWARTDWEPPDVWVPEGEVVVAGIEMEAVLTAGHTRGHLVFDNPAAGVIFTGDHVLPTISPSIGFELGEWKNPLGQYLNSLNSLLSRPDAEMLPAHGDAGGSVHARVQQLLLHHDQRLEATLNIARKRPGVTGLGVSRVLRWSRSDRSFGSLDDFNRMVAICETMAHLDVLTDQRLIEVTDVGAEGEIHYEVT